jgi:predicted YcjX-like family ATPase
VVPVLQAAMNPSGVCAPFFPVDAESRQHLPRLLTRLKKEYAAYQNASVRPFLQRIAACSHQIVLVDVLDILRNGVEKFDEVRDQMQRVLNCYRQVNGGWIPYIQSILPFIGRPLIRRVSFCATKADQATRDNRDNLTSLLRDLFVRAEQALHFDRRTIQKIDFLAIASHRCTDDIDTDHEGKPIVALRGRLFDDMAKNEGPYFPGRVPQQWPEHKEDWRAFRFPDFLPRKLPDIATGRPLPHIKMDQVLFSVVENLLR